MNKPVILVAALVVLVALVVTSFYMGRQYEQSFRPSTPTNVVVAEHPKPPVPTAVELPPCIYNDHFGYKLLRFRHGDGTQCYGIRPYDRGKFEAMWCEK